MSLLSGPGDTGQGDLYSPLFCTGPLPSSGHFGDGNLGGKWHLEMVTVPGTAGLLAALGNRAGEKEMWAPGAYRS